MVDQVFPADFTEITSLEANDYTPVVTDSDGEMKKIKTTNLKGATGNGITSVVKTNTVGLVDTYTITFTDATTTTFDITNGEAGIGISTVVLFSTVGKIKTYRITFTDATTFDFIVTDGADGGGSGDMLKSTYDPTNKNQDIFAYADGLVAGLLDFRGGYDASVNTFPATGGSGTAGAILKGDTWAISVAGTLGGVVIQVGDVILATVDTPGQTTGNWTKLNTNISYVPEDVANKETSTLDTSTTKYPCNNVVKTAVDGKQNTMTKATGSEVDTGTDDAKYVTAKAIEDSSYIKSGVALPLAGGTMTGKTTTAGSSEVAKTYTPASGSQTVAIDCAVNNIHEVTGNASGTAITFTVANVTNSQVFMIAITQGAVVSTIAGWFATIKWAGGTAPTLTATVGKRDTFGFRRTGANTYDGFVIGANC